MCTNAALARIKGQCERRERAEILGPLCKIVLGQDLGIGTFDHHVTAIQKLHSQKHSEIKPVARPALMT